MRFFVVSPKFLETEGPYSYEDTDHTHQCIEKIANFIVDVLQPEIDETLFGYWHRNEVGPQFVDEFGWGEVLALKVKDRSHLKSLLMESGNPFGDMCLAIRSVGTCRSVNYGHDGQAFLVARTDDEMTNLDDVLFRVEEELNYLTPTDYADGLTLDGPDI